MSDLIEMWRAHCAIARYLLKHLPEGGLEAVPDSGGVHVGQMFAHMNDARLREMGRGGVAYGSIC